MYKKASRLKLRVSTSKGNLSVEQLWSLSVNELDTLAVGLESGLEKRQRKSFITPTTKTDEISELKFNIVLDILGTKVSERNSALEEAEKKAHNQKILQAIEDRRDSNLKEMSEEELIKLLK